LREYASETREKGIPIMGTKDPRIDAYIAKAPAFAKPILAHLRQLVHRGCPDVVETIKWSCPHFDYKGMMCGMAAFKSHCSFGFWNGALDVPEKQGAMGNFGPLKLLADLPKDSRIVRWVKEAAALNEAGVKRRPLRRTKPRRNIAMPRDLSAALKRNAKARATFEAFSPSHRREYLEWITEAKTDETRQRRLATALEWMAEGKSRNWKYMPARKSGPAKSARR
jgi:uncharacterized protein YdeI (YjbR/CyaY-like superfamily)